MDLVSLKIIVIGDYSVGKTTLLQRFTEGIYNEKTLSTIGIELFKKEISINNKKYIMKIWDTCGQEKFRSISRNYYHNAQGIMLLFDVNSKLSFEHLSYWIESIIQNILNKNTPSVIVACKNDLTQIVTDQEIEEFSTKNNIKVFKTSVKDNIAVEEPFLYLGEEIIKSGIYIEKKIKFLEDIDVKKKFKKKRKKC